MSHCAQRIGGERHQNGIEVDQQRIRNHVIGLQGLPIELGRIPCGGLQKSFVDDHITLYFLHPQAFELLQQMRCAFNRQFGIQSAANDHIAHERPRGLYRPCGVDSGFPGVLGTQQVQCSLSGNELHQRGGRSGLLGQVHQPGRLLNPLAFFGALFGHLLDHHTQRAGRNVCCFKTLLDGFWQYGLDHGALRTRSNKRSRSG